MFFVSSFLIVCCFKVVCVNIEISFTASINENKANRVEDLSRTIYNRFLQGKHTVLNNMLILFVAGF